MDLVQYSQVIFSKILQEFSDFSKKIGIEKFKAIPISALQGDNLTKKSSKMNWYKGKSLISELENFEAKISDNSNKNFIMPVQLVSRFNNQRIYSGNIVKGSARINKKIKIMPSGFETKISKIYSLNGQKVFKEQEAISFSLKDKLDCSRGDVFCSVNQNVKLSDQFEIIMIWMNKKSLIPGRQYWIKWY